MSFASISIRKSSYELVVFADATLTEHDVDVELDEGHRPNESSENRPALSLSTYRADHLTFLQMGVKVVIVHLKLCSGGLAVGASD